MEELKYIVTELNKIFDTDYNMLSFDSLSVTDLLQVVVNVLAMCNATPSFQVNKNLDQAILSILNGLQTIKYVPQNDIDAAEFREGLINGKRNIIHPILYWILSNAENVKKRVYFASYVEKVEVPAEIQMDPEIQQMNVVYNAIIEEFWNCYNENKNEKKNADEATEYQKDTKKMTTEITFLTQRLEKQNEKLKNIPNRENLLASVKAYRREEKQEEKYRSQLKEQKQILNDMNVEIKTLQGTLGQMSVRRPEHMDPIQKVSEELEINKILLDNQLPKENQDIIMEINAFQKVVFEPDPTQEELDSINNNIDDVSKEVQVLLNKKIALTSTNDEQLLPFRNQALIISNKKKELSSFIMKIKTKNDSVIEEINQKSFVLRGIVGGDVLHGEQLKVFVTNLRERSVIYKKYRSFLQGMQAELGIVTRTLEILKIGDSTIENALKLKKSNRNDAQDIIGDDIAELKYKCKLLYQDANLKRSESVKIYDNMIDLRSAFSNFNDNFDETKKIFDNATGNLTTELTKMDKNCEEIEESTKKHEDEWKNLKKEIENYEMLKAKYGNDADSSSFAVAIQQLSLQLNEMTQNKKKIESKLDLLKQQKSNDREDLEQLKRIKQMIFYKMQGS